ncbi:hypothetical protein RBI13_18930 [Alcaligenaceae bacterium A4P071]|nr:hypothetical protein [Alcaligenaceae bacterium A4P071]
MSSFSKSAITFFVLGLIVALLWWDEDRHRKNIGVVQCPDRTIEQLEQTVIDYWKWKSKYFWTSKEQADSFFRTHQFKRDEVTYTPSSSLWGVPFTMVSTRDNVMDVWIAIVGCGGNVEFSIRPRHWPKSSG